MLSPSRSPGRFSRLSRQRGAVGIGLILLMVSMVLFLAMAVDTGRLYMEKRKLQKQADLAALSLGRSACYIDGINNKEALETLVKQNLAANGFDTTASNPTIEFGAAQISGNEWQFEPASTAVKSAGRVTLSKTVPGSLISQLYNPNDVTLSASAAVYKQISVEFGVGSGLVNIDLDSEKRNLANLLLGEILGGNVDIGSYKGLIETHVKIGRLLSVMEDKNLLDVELSVAELDQVLDSEIVIADFINAMIEAVDTSQLLAASAISDLEGISNPTTMLNVNELEFKISDILQLAAGSDDAMNEEIRRAALVSNIAIYDLVSGAIYAANGANAIAIDTLKINTGESLGLGLLGLELNATIIEPPKFKVGVLPVPENGSATSVETAQIRLDIGIDLPLPTIPNLVETNLAFGLSLEAAKAEARLLDMTDCNIDGYKMKFGVTPTVAAIKLGDKGNTNIPAKLSAGLLGGALELNINLGANIPVSPPEEKTLLIDAEHGDIPDVYGLETPINEHLDGLLTNLNVVITTSVKSFLDPLGLLDVLVTPAINGLVSTLLSVIVEPILKPVILLVADQVLVPLLSLLGIQVGTADVFVTSIDVDGGGLIQ
ncbi:pilus assembly protein TadG-related protein [Photobacterium salinisoli]|uniref:pilus assembly protein TadG-related protein n=1 Tax=Photobacterium salinisoli TaxID=1616783 RepID=UPI000EA20930|nr:pilus assembly protein TadG-related protein [Photobacterium salinisoli]